MPVMPDSLPAITVVQRQTLDWQTITPEQFQPLSAAFCRLWGKPENYVFRLMQLWDSTFALGYFATRARLKAIAEANIGSTAGVCFAPYAAYRNIPDQYGFYIFMDDDDWVSPELARVLCAQSPNTQAALLWRAANVGSPQQEYPVFVWGLNGRCMTNNYAISSVWLDHLRKLDGVVQHATAAETLASFDNVLQLDAALTASNKSPCSSVSLDRGLQGDLSSSKLAQLVDDYVQRMNNVPESDTWMVPWIRPLVEETVALFQQVSASRIT